MNMIILGQILKGEHVGKRWEIRYSHMDEDYTLYVGGEFYAASHRLQTLLDELYLLDGCER